MRAASRLLRAAEQIQQPLHEFVPRLQHRIQHALPAAWPHQAARSAGQSSAGLKAWDVAARCLHATVASTVAAAAGSSALSGSLACRAAASLRQHAAAHGTGCTTGGSVGARCFRSHTAQRAAGAGGCSSSGSMGAHAAAAPSAAWRASGWSVTAAQQAATVLRPAAQALRCELRAAFLPAATFSSSQQAAAGGATAAGRASARGIPCTPAGAAAAVAGVATRRTGRCLPAGAAAAAMRQQARGYNGYGRVSYSSPYAAVTLNRGLDPMHMLYGLIGANVAGFVMWQTNPGFMARHFMVSPQHIREGRIYTLLTSALSHAEPQHLLVNMITLYFFGHEIALLFGPKLLLGLYCAGGIAASAAHVAWYWYKAAKEGGPAWAVDARLRMSPPALGASGAVSAIVIADILLAPMRMVILFPIPIPMPSFILGILWVYSDISGSIRGEGNIGHVAHLGGAATGAAFYWAWRKGLLRRRW